MSEMIDTNAKALRMNLDHSVYGAFAEIGGGQEVSRWFFRVGGAAGTVAKTMSAYDMAVSDAIYGSGERYVSRERVRSMLDHEYGLLIERLGATRGDKTSFFAFAATVATRSFKGGNECHGWMGLRFQHQPGAEVSEIVIHAALGDPTAALQQQTLGVLGVNLLYGAYYLRESFGSFLASLLDGLALENVEVDVVDCSGPAFAGSTDQREIAIQMLGRGLTHAVVFDEQARMEQPSTVFRKRGLLVHRCSLSRENSELDQMMQGAAGMLEAEGGAGERGALRVLEIGVPVCEGEDWESTCRAQCGRAFGPGCASILTVFRETYRLSEFLRRYSSEQVRFVLGLAAMIAVMRAAFYKGKLEGGLLEALGKLLSVGTKLYVFPMRAEVLRERLKVNDIEPEFWSGPVQQVLGVDDVTLAAPAGHLFEFLKSAEWMKAGQPADIK